MGLTIYKAAFGGKCRQQVTAAQSANIEMFGENTLTSLRDERTSKSNSESRVVLKRGKEPAVKFDTRIVSSKHREEHEQRIGSEIFR